MKKMLHIITLSKWGGAQQVLFDIVTNTDKKKYLIEVACSPGGHLVNKLKKRGITVYEIVSLKRNLAPFSSLRALLALYQLIKRGEYDIVHCHSSKAGILGRISACLAGIPKVYFTVHGWGFYNQEEYGWAQKLLIFLEKVAAKCSTKIICVSENDKKEGIRRKITKENKFLLIRNGTNWEVKENREKIRRKLGVSENEIVFGMVGRLSYPKNPLMFLRIADEIVKKYSKAKFVLIGNGPLFKECRDFIRENTLENNIFLLGEKSPEETRKLLLGFDVFVLTSKFEGSPISIIEAMFAGQPVVASNVGGVSELIFDQKNGFLVKDQDVDKFVEILTILFEKPQLRLSMGEEGRKIGHSQFGLREMIRSYERLYEE